MKNFKLQNHLYSITILLLYYIVLVHNAKQLVVSTLRDVITVRIRLQNNDEGVKTNMMRKNLRQETRRIESDGNSYVRVLYPTGEEGTVSF